VDDIDINREILTELLQSSGIVTETATNGKEALEAFCRAEPYWYDLILMDMQMPKLDGLCATEQIRALGCPEAGRIPIIAMTANAFKEDAQMCLDAGMNGHLAKPLDVDLLYRTLAQYLS
jgi:CheY-like chemotaxis protein